MPAPFLTLKNPLGVSRIVIIALAAAVEGDGAILSVGLSVGVMLSVVLVGVGVSLVAPVPN